MFRTRRHIYLFYLVVDIILAGISFYLPYSLRYSGRLVMPACLPQRVDYALLFSFWGLALIFFLHNHRLFATDRLFTIPKETWLVFKCVVFSSILAGLVVFLLQMKFFSRLVFAGAAILLFVNLSLWRAIKRLIIRQRINSGYYNINALIVDAGRAGQALVRQIQGHPYLGIKIVGFLDDEKNAKVLGYSVLGRINDLEQVIQRHFIDEIYVTIPSERKKVAEILSLGRRLNKTVRILADNFTLFSDFLLDDEGDAVPSDFVFPFRHVKLTHIGPLPLISYVEAGLHGSEGVIKRVIDIVVSYIALVMLAPFFVLIAILIRLDSPGPVFYRSLRCGKKGKLFVFYKFRTMIKDADKHKDKLRHMSEVKGPVFKIKNDPRVTRIGRLLRRYSIDELPQLINVLKGEMSLVGPRPPTPDEVAKYEAWQLRRLDVKPGITCLWQVRGRSNLSFYKWVKWDLWYIDNWSLGLDLLILLWTIPAVLKRQGAY